MGVIYSPQEFADRRIPTQDGHLNAANATLDAMQHEPGVKLAIVHGSVVDSRSNIRSDLDVYAEYDNDNGSGLHIVRSIREALQTIRKETHVHVEATIWPHVDARPVKEARFTDILFSRYLWDKMQDNIWRVGEPNAVVGSIATDSWQPSVVRQAVVTYMAQKHTSFLKAPATFNDKNGSLPALQRCMELPKMVKQKVGQLAIAAEIEAVNDADPYQLFHDYHGIDSIIGPLAKLAKIDQDYTAVLHDRDKYNTASYSQWLGDVYDTCIELGLVATASFNDYLSEIFLRQKDESV